MNDGGNTPPDGDQALRARVAELETELARTRASEARFRAFLIHGGVAVTWLAADGRIVMINEVGATNLGGRPSDFVGRTIYEVIPALEDQTRERVHMAFAGEVREYETQLELPDSLRWFVSVYYPVYDVEENIIAAQVVSQDLTRLRMAERALAKSQSLLDAAQRRAQLGTWELDPITGHLEWSKQMYALMDVDEAQPAPTMEGYLQLIHPEDRERVARAQIQSVRAETPRVFDFRTNPARGPVRHMSGTIETREERGGRIVRLEGTVMDVTAHRLVAEERKQLQAQMEHAQKLESLGVLAGGIAHDFNNLLVAVMGNAELTLLDLTEPDRAREHLHEILSASHRAAELCGQMLAYSGRGQFIVRPTDLSRIVRDMAHLLEVSISKRARLVSTLPEGLPAVEADETQIGQIVMNLITNASDAIGDTDGQVSIRTGLRHCTTAHLANAYVDDHLPAGEYVYLEVADDGCGMDPEQRSRMFDPFFSSKATGRGLGLAAVLGIIRGHRGAIDVETVPGRGTRVTVLFPASEQPVEESIETGEWETPPLGEGSVMVVDDEAPVRALAERALERSGYLVFTSSDGAGAVEFFREYRGKIDIVLLDVTMPKMGGRETLDHLREIDPSVRVILMSGYDEESAVPGLVHDRKSDFLQKPFRPTSLIERVQRMLKRPG